MKTIFKTITQNKQIKHNFTFGHLTFPMLVVDAMPSLQQRSIVLTPPFYIISHLLKFIATCDNNEILFKSIERTRLFSTNVIELME